jgi:hypothetical protein
MFPTPPFLKGARGLYDKDGQDPDRPRAHEARGLNRKKLTPNKRGPSMPRGLKRRSTPRYNALKTSEESNTPSRPRGLHPAGALARTHRKSYDATPLVHDSLSL